MIEKIKEKEYENTHTQFIAYQHTCFVGERRAFTSAADNSLSANGCTVG
jgi:hypothetical protein